MARTQRRRAATVPATSGAQPAPQARRVREGGPRPATSSSSAAGLTRLEPRKRRNPFGFLKKLQPRFVGDVIAELRKVTWPTMNETWYLTTVVAIVAVVMGIFLGLLDLTFGWVIERIFF
jgi:preprotein translocase subunit SecE